MPTRTFEYSSLSIRLINTPAPIPPTVVATTITAAASRPDGGSRRNRWTRFSITFTRPIAPPVSAVERNRLVRRRKNGLGASSGVAAPALAGADRVALGVHLLFERD